MHATTKELHGIMQKSCMAGLWRQPAPLSCEGHKGSSARHGSGGGRGGRAAAGAAEAHIQQPVDWGRLGCRLWHRHCLAAQEPARRWGSVPPSSQRQPSCRASSSVTLPLRLASRAAKMRDRLCWMPMWGIAAAMQHGVPSCRDLQSNTCMSWLHPQASSSTPPRCRGPMASARSASRPSSWSTGWSPRASPCGRWGVSSTTKCTTCVPCAPFCSAQLCHQQGVFPAGLRHSLASWCAAGHRG